MKHLTLAIAIIWSLQALARDCTVKSPDGRLEVTVSCDSASSPVYTVTHDGRVMLQPSPLGIIADFGNLADSLTITGCSYGEQRIAYSCRHIKKSMVDKLYSSMTVEFVNPRGQRLDAEFLAANNDVTFRYAIPRDGATGAIRVMEERTGFRLPDSTTTFLTPQSDAMTGWKRSKPSYEEKYRADAPMDSVSAFGNGFTFPALFHTPGDGWILVSETGVDSRYCASRLSDANDGLYAIRFPMPEENNGNGTVEPAFALPGHTPWRTVTVGGSLAPVAETTVMWDVVQPRYAPSTDYKPGPGTWSWILWQDNSINEADQQAFIDLAAEMGYTHTLVDSGWDVTIGRDGMKRLSDYGRSKGVELYVWYSSSGYWNDITQSPVNIMDNPITRKNEMKWLREIDATGIKVDFFGGDKQETMRLYEEILSDANDFGLMVIFHGCTLPRGWERMYPNYVGSEAVLASENLIFTQTSCDEEAFSATLHPFIRNAVGAMEFGGTLLNRRMSRSNSRGNIRRTGDVFQLATAVLFQSPAQNFALTPNNLTDAPDICMDFMRDVPTLWDDTRLLDGYPGKYVALLRRSGKRAYAAAVNATSDTKEITLNLKPYTGLNTALYTDTPSGPSMSGIVIPDDGQMSVTIPSEGGAVIVIDIPESL